MGMFFDHWFEDDEELRACAEKLLDYRGTPIKEKEEKTMEDQVLNDASDESVSTLTKKLFETSVQENETRMSSIKELCIEVLPKYPQEKKYYHSVWHIIDLCKKLDDYAIRGRVSVNDWTTLFLAIVLHDVVYRVGASDNEDQSIALAAHYLSIHRIKGVDREEVFSLIEATKISHSEFRTESEKIIHDLDWSGFLDHDTMVFNEELIRNEAIRDGFSDDEFYQGQLRFYQLASKMDIYKTYAYARYNDHARSNILRRIKALEQVVGPSVTPWRVKR